MRIAFPTEQSKEEVTLETQLDAQEMESHYLTYLEENSG